MSSILARRRMGGIKPISDAFNRANGTVLTVTDTGQPWTIISGTWTTNDNRAYTSTAASSEPKAVVDFRAADVPSFTVELGTKDAAYVRYVDDNNFVRVVRGGYQTSGTSYCTYTNYNASGDSINCSICGWTCSAGGCGCNNSSPSCNNGGYCGNPGSPCNQWIGCSCRCVASGTCSVACGTWYADNYRYKVEQKVAGTLTTLFNGSVYSTGMASFTITTSVDTLTVTDTRQATGALTMNSALRTATKFGIGRANYDSYDSTAIDNFALTPA